MKVDIQVGTMNAPLRNTIWNFVTDLIPPRSRNERLHHEAIALIAANVLRIPTERVGWEGPVGWLLDEVEKMTWAEVYELLEFAVGMAPVWGRTPTPDVFKLANLLLAREHSGYRFVNGRLAPITNTAEISEIERAAELATATGLDGVRQQIDNAVKLLGRRPEPDYPNAIKESISAVEGVVRLINGTRGGGLRAALEALSVKIDLHPALKTALEKLWAYASNEDGIRHASLEEANVDEADARFMIVTCSAIVNLLIVKAEVAGLLPSQK